MIFDIDGTLVESSGFEDDLYVAAVRDVLGDVCIRERWSTYRHVTDTGILRQIMEENRIQGHERIREVRTRYGDMVSQYLRDGGECNPIEGAVNLIDELRGTHGYSVGFATGGWGHTARMKLEHAGFNPDNVVLASGDDSEERTGIMQKCLNTLDDLNALGNSFQRIVYIGDAEWDIQATRELGWRFIGVGPRLKGACKYWVENFLQRETFMELLHAR